MLMEVDGAGALLGVGVALEGVGVTALPLLLPLLFLLVPEVALALGTGVVGPVTPGLRVPEDDVEPSRIFTGALVLPIVAALAGFGLTTAVLFKAEFKALAATLLAE